jgi:AraC-like DNA-binding protein
MNYYNKQVSKLTAELYSKEYLTRQIIQAKHFIDQHYADKINLDDIAAKANMSKFHFQRIFKSMYGRTPGQHLTDTRIARAKILLQQGISVAEVCAAVGFDSSTSFAGLFKRNTGLPPTAYFLQQRKKSKIGEP